MTPKASKARRKRGGLGLLDVETTLLPDKTLTRVTATHVASGTEIEATKSISAVPWSRLRPPFARIGDHDDGATSADGRVSGTYIHGCFASDDFRSPTSKSLGAESSDLAFETLIEKTLDDLAAHLEQHLDLDQLLELAGEPYDPALCRGSSGPLRRSASSAIPKQFYRQIGHPSNGLAACSQSSRPCFMTADAEPLQARLRGVAALLALLLAVTVPAVATATFLSTFGIRLDHRSPARHRAASPSTPCMNM